MAAVLPVSEVFCAKSALSLNENDDRLLSFLECDNPFGPRATWLPWELLHKVIICGARAFDRGLQNHCTLTAAGLSSA